MKNLKIFGIIVSLALIMLPMMSCMTNELKARYEGTTYDIAIPAKDFEILGVVRVETTVSRNDTRSRGNGEFITYDALLKAAEAKGGNGIVNVMIDKRVTTSSSNITDTYYGTALAIKYTNTVTPNTPISTSNRNVDSESNIWKK